MINIPFLRLGAIICFIFCQFIAIAGEPVILEYSDTLIGTQDSVMNIRKLIGNVRLTQGNVKLSCDRAIQYINSNQYDLIGNVVIKQNTLTLRSPNIKYDGNTYIATGTEGISIVDKETKLNARQGTYSTMTLIAEFQKEVVVEDDSVIIYSDFVRHNRNDRISNAWGNVIIDGKYTNSTLLGDSVVNVPAVNYSSAFGNPKLIQIDSIPKLNQDSSKYFQFDTLTIVSNRMEAYRDFGDEKYIATGKVEIIRNEMLAKAGKGIYYKDKDHIFLEEVPVIWYDKTQLFADSIDVFIKNNNLSLIKARTKAFSVSTSDSINLSRADQLSGDRIEIVFDGDSLKFIDSYGSAKSVYFVQTDNQPDGLIRVSADKITIQMSDGKAETIIMTDKVPGEYAPEQIISGREKDYYLPSFRSDKDKPQRIDIEKLLIPRKKSDKK